MALEALDQVVGVHDELRQARKDVRVRIDLVVKVAGDPGEFFEGVIECRRKLGDTGVRVGEHAVGAGERRAGVGERAGKLRIDVRWQQPLAERTAAIGQVGRDEGQVPDQRPGVSQEFVGVPGGAGGLREHFVEPVGQRQEIRDGRLDLVNHLVEPLGQRGRFVGQQVEALGDFRIFAVEWNVAARLRVPNPLGESQLDRLVEYLKFVDTTRLQAAQQVRRDRLTRLGQ